MRLRVDCETMSTYTLKSECFSLAKLISTEEGFVSGANARLISLTLQYSFSHCLPTVEFQPSSSLSTGCVVSLRGDWAIFCQADPGCVGRVWSAKKKSPYSTTAWNWTRARGRTDSEIHLSSHRAIATETIVYPTKNPNVYSGSYRRIYVVYWYK